ncbi:hypothetical protein GO988_01240 [Hymenobacter sp. HMF4947]|uniref:Lipoprotein n=1 Tax=Hymenobacter ginkgonis TaxID=2682976 RepID=A0A7K1T9H1_9BACT|nr:hypothetical protein [Hymenobacter ginkgonis]MVN74942.1 hypothetical protein [Hymenobacter ginkgonis]
MKIKLVRVAVGLLLVGGVGACSKDTAVPPEEAAPGQPEFFVRANTGAALWVAPGSGTYVKSKKQFYVFGQAGTAAEATSLSLGFALPARPALAPVQALPAAWYVLVGFDAATNSYATADAASLPTLQVTRLDTVAKIVEGRFEAVLQRDKHWTKQVEQLSLANGSFRVRYQEVP